jgi:hypothetical protein
VNRRLVSFYFGGGQYERLAAVLEMTARRHCPDWSIEVLRIDPPALRAASGRDSDAANHYKLARWVQACHEARDGEQLLLVDADTFVNAPLDPLWDGMFDFGYTVRPSDARYPLNAGVIAVRAGGPARRLMDAWLAQDAVFLEDAEALRPWRARYGGMNQASLGALLDTGVAFAVGAGIALLPCLEWNCEDSTWERFDAERTRIVHVKSGLRQAALGDWPARPKTRELASMWRALDVQARHAQAGA